MKSHEAIEKAVGKDAEEFAKALRLSRWTVIKWKEPHEDFTDSGSINPLDRIETVISTALRLGRSRADSIAPIHYLAQQNNCILIDVGLPFSKHILSKELLKTVKEFGDVADEAGKALEDGTLSRQELKRLKKEGWELINQMMSFLKRAEEAVK